MSYKVGNNIDVYGIACKVVKIKYWPYHGKNTLYCIPKDSEGPFFHGEKLVLKTVDIPNSVMLLKSYEKHLSTLKTFDAGQFPWLMNNYDDFDGKNYFWKGFLIVNSHEKLFK